MISNVCTPPMTIQPIVNELCKEYGLSIQDIEVGTEEKLLKKWDKTKQGIFKWNHQVSLDVEDSISFANSYDNFLKLMELKGYELKQKNGETFLKPMGEKRFIRLADISARTIMKTIWLYRMKSLKYMISTLAVNKRKPLKMRLPHS